MAKKKPNSRVNEYNIFAIIEKARPVFEDEIKIREKYCIVFGCGKLLSLDERRFGNKCIKHQKQNKIYI